MASEGPRSPTAATLDATVGTANWVKTSNGSFTDAALLQCVDAFDSSRNEYAVRFGGSGTLTKYLRATGFGFTTIPDTATVDGIVVEFRSFATTTAITENSIRLYRGSWVGDDKATGGNWTAGYNTRGGAADLWGTTWTPAQIKASNFGVGISVDDANATQQASLGHIRITVYYTEAGGGGGAASRLTKYAQNIPYMHGNNRFIRIGR
jgi:hypothetical protein